MINRYWREYPWLLQGVLFISMLLIFFGFSALALQLVLRMTGMSLADVTTLAPGTPREQVNVFLLVQGITSVFAFLIPPLLFANVAHPRPSWYLGLRRPGKPLHWLLAVVIILSALPFMLQISVWIGQIDFGPAIKKEQENVDAMMKELMNIGGFRDFIIAFIVLAIIPGISEELFFRGIVMRFAAQKAHNIWLPIAISAAIFAFFHSNPYGLPGIFIAGALLGTIYYLTGSLWCSILAHMVHNGIQIVMNYWANGDPAAKEAMNSNVLPWYLPAGGLIILSASLYILWKNRTPLPQNWTDDFADEKPESRDNFTA